MFVDLTYAIEWHQYENSNPETLTYFLKLKNFKC